MKEQFEKQCAKMTDDEQRRIWQAITDERKKGRRRGIPWLPMPAAIGGAALAVLLLITYVNLDDTKKTEVDRLASGTAPHELIQEGQPVLQGPGIPESTEERALVHDAAPGDVTPDVAPEDDRVVPSVIVNEERPPQKTVKQSRPAEVATKQAAGEAKSALQKKDGTLSFKLPADKPPADKAPADKALSDVPTKSSSAPAAHAGGEPVRENIIPVRGSEPGGTIMPVFHFYSAVGSLATIWQQEAEQREAEAEARRVARGERRRAESEKRWIADSDKRRIAEANRWGAEAKKRRMARSQSQRAGTLEGTVHSSLDGKPIPYANIIIGAIGRGGTTQSDGTFSVPSIPAGVYQIKVNRIGYYSREIENVEIKVGETTTINVQLDTSRTTLDAIEVTDHHDKIELNREQKGRLHALGYMNGSKPSPEKDVSHRSDTRKTDSEPAPEEGNWGNVKGLFRGGGGPTSSEPKSESEAGSSFKLFGAVNDLHESESQRYPISVGGTDPVNGRAFDAMFFEHYGVNPFIDPMDDSLSTFAVDVDNGSYTLTRSYLERHTLPPKDAVRVEEFINFFDHRYAPPRPSEFVPASYDRRGWEDENAFAIHLDAAPSRFGEDLVLLRVGLKGREIDVRNRKPANLTFVIDVSGSMARENRLELVKRTLFLLLDELKGQDHVAIVVYGSRARTVLPPMSLENRSIIESAIASLTPSGSTNAEQGLVEGYINAARAFQPGWINRVILCSDGVANVGRTGAEDILKRIARDASRGVELTSVGFGMGNYNDVLMEKLADNGDGNYYYVGDIDEARRVFVENLTGTLQSIAKQVKVQVDFEPGTVRRYRLIGYENRDVADRDFRNDQVDAGEVGAGHEVTALFEVKLEKRPESKKLATVRLRWESPETGKVTEREESIRLRDVHDRFENAPPRFRFDAAIAEFAEILRKSYWARESDLGFVYDVARDASRDITPSKEIEEAIRLIDAARALEWRKNWDLDDPVVPRWDPRFPNNQ